VVDGEQRHVVTDAHQISDADPCPEIHVQPTRDQGVYADGQQLAGVAEARDSHGALDVGVLTDADARSPEHGGARSAEAGAR
jgi:hypothetical protein